MDIFTYDQKLHEEVIAEEAEERGIERGEVRKLILQTIKKLNKGKSTKLIARELEEEETVINRICKAAQETAPEYDVDKIYEIINKN